jgi:hypothetical protein
MKREVEVTTDGQSASLSWCRFCLTVVGFLMCGALSGERMGL